MALEVPTLIMPTSGSSFSAGTTSVTLWAQNLGYTTPAAGQNYIYTTGTGKITFQGNGKIYIY